MFTDPTALLAELTVLAGLEEPRAPWAPMPPAGTTREQLDLMTTEVLAYFMARDDARMAHGERCSRAYRAFLYADSGIPWSWPTGWPTDWTVLSWCLDLPQGIDADHWIEVWRHDAEVHLGFATGTIHEKRRRDYLSTVDAGTVE